MRITVIIRKCTASSDTFAYNKMPVMRCGVRKAAARTEKRPDNHLPGAVSQPFSLPATFPPQLRSVAQPLRSKRGSTQLAHAVAALVRRRGRSVSSERG